MEMSLKYSKMDNNNLRDIAVNLRQFLGNAGHKG